MFNEKIQNLKQKKESNEDEVEYDDYQVFLKKIHKQEPKAPSTIPKTSVKEDPKSSLVKEASEKRFVDKEAIKQKEMDILLNKPKDEKTKEKVVSSKEAIKNKLEAMKSKGATDKATDKVTEKK